MEASNSKLNKALAGYHLLVMIAHSDGVFSSSEEKVVKAYLSSNSGELKNLDAARNRLKEMKNDDRFYHFQQAAVEFYAQSTEHERMAFINLVFELIQSDRKISIEENHYLNELYNTWGLD